MERRLDDDSLPRYCTTFGWDKVRRREISLWIDDEDAASSEDGEDVDEALDRGSCFTAIGKSEERPDR